MIPNFIDNFEKASYIERLYFENFQKLYNFFKPERWDISKTSYMDNAPYDILLQEWATYKRLIIEIKIREERFPEYIYETKKHNSLMKVKNLDPTNNTIIYMCSTPDGTYLWNIDNIISKYEKTSLHANKATMDSKTNKVDKRCYLLKPEDAFKHFEYKWDIKQFNEIVMKERLDKEMAEELKRQDRDMMGKFIFGK